MKNAVDFIRFALSHAKPETIPPGAKLPLETDECGTSPWEYLPGTAGDRVTEEMLETLSDSSFASDWLRSMRRIAERRMGEDADNHTAIAIRLGER